MPEKKKSRAGSTAAKRSRGPKDVAEYLARVPEAARSSFAELRATIQSAVPRDAIEIISYGIPAFRRGGVLVWFAAFSNHCSLFPTAAIIDEFRDELEGFSTSKGTIHFPVDKPLPTALIRKIVKARVAQMGDRVLK
ncbi:MAG TPA: DUF1801 domain-containing protein [Candidatus Binatia bacterium]|nr:DUF1801 domain-containing protein [Candidatus Binatia bacterium]